VTIPTYERTIPAELGGLSELHRELAAFLEEQDVPNKAWHDAQLVCEELIVNAIRHGLGERAGAEHRIDLAIVLGDRSIQIRIEDDLPLFDPTSVPLPPPRRSLADAPVGGRGLALVRAATTQFRWRSEGGRNITELEVSLSPRGHQRAGN